MPDFASFSTARSLLPTRSWEQGLVLNTSCPCSFHLSFYSQFLIQAVRGQQSQEQTRFALEGTAGTAAFRLHLWGFANEAVLQRVSEVHEMPVLLLFYILTRLCKHHFRECTAKVTETRK